LQSSAPSLRRDARVIGLVAVAHGMSHFLQLALPPLFPLLRAEFDASWTLLGSLVGVFYAASGVTQFAAGFAVDRYGARRVLLAGTALFVGGTIAAAIAPGLYWLFPIVALMGVGNGVFHPADFAILNSSVGERRLGHAYSTHGIGGNLGYAAAPVASFALGAVLGWRGALVVIGVAGVAILAMLVAQKQYLGSHTSTSKHTLRGSASLFLQLPILACFVYFIVQTVAGTGLQTFAANTLNAGFGVTLALANAAVTAYLLGSVAGILAGGFLAVRTPRHDRVAASGLFVGAALVLVVAAGVPPSLLLPLFAATGFAVGTTGPSRDLIVKSATPKGASGRVYGFVYSGLDIGSTLAPIWFGLMLDHAMARGVFVAIGALFLAAIGTVIQVKRALVARAA
jgi:MFS family permease